tara:strand:- start:512 stop:883 length:372 start_codon:yes stop_codon:yes gene_type:complete
MNNLIIDAAGDKILFKIITDSKSYTTDYSNNRENFDKLVVLLFNFLAINNIKINEVSNIFVNQGPGKFSGIRASIAVAKALSLVNNLTLYGFFNYQVVDKNYNKIMDLFNKNLLKKNLLKPQY